MLGLCVIWDAFSHRAINWQVIYIFSWQKYHRMFVWLDFHLFDTFSRWIKCVCNIHWGRHLSSKIILRKRQKFHGLGMHKTFFQELLQHLIDFVIQVMLKIWFEMNFSYTKKNWIRKITTFLQKTLPIFLDNHLKILIYIIQTQKC